jgi:hypothetical protein
MIILELGLNKEGISVWIGLCWLRIEFRGGRESDNESTGSTKSGTFLDKLSRC